MKNPLSPSLTSSLPLDDEQISFFTEEIRKHAPSLRLKVVFLGQLSELNDLDKTRLLPLLEYWSCHSLPDLFRLNLDATCDLFVVTEQMEHSSLTNFKNFCRNAKEMMLTLLR